MRSNREVAHIFSELYAAPPERMAHYLKAKVLELLMLLNDLPQESFSEKRQFFSRSQITAVRAIHDAMIQDLSHHYTLAELSRQKRSAMASKWISRSPMMASREESVCCARGKSMVMEMP